MRHYVAVQDPSTGRWFYANEGRSRITGADGWIPTRACTQRPLKTCPHCGGAGTFASERKPECQCSHGMVDDPDVSPCPGHATAEEAYAHEKARLTQKARFWPDDPKARSQHRCEASGCEQFTSGSGEAGQYRHHYLCAEHRTPEHLAPLVRVGESWES